MKRITYQIQTPSIGLVKKILQCADEKLDSALVIANAEAYKNDITIEDVDDFVEVPTRLDRVEARLAYVAMMTDTLMED